jgi:hypothetical protein
MQSRHVSTDRAVSMSAALDVSSTMSAQAVEMKMRAGLLAGLALASLLAGCSTFEPTDGVPQRNEGLEYPAIGAMDAGKQKPVLTPAERTKLENDLSRYKVGNE